MVILRRHFTARTKRKLQSELGREIAGWGQPEVAFNDLALIASGMPAAEAGYFLVADTAGFISLPGGSQGNLCLGGKIGRFVGQVASTGTCAHGSGGTCPSVALELAPGG